ncbi:MAG: hypothetical protein J6A79_04205 [Clostridia bacterium]|nr:hypothetical protein [Clostridia bacterium]
MNVQKNDITVGIPRALLYHRYGTLWQVFFEELGTATILSPPSSREILERGSAIAIDETCLSNKLYMGHVEALIGTCDEIFIPRYSNLGRCEGFCTRFEGLYDQARNIFRDTSQRFLSCNIDALHHQNEEKAFEELGKTLGFSGKEARHAYSAALKADEKQRRERTRKHSDLWDRDSLKILVAGHSYILSDAYIGKPVLDTLEHMGVTVICADQADRNAALAESEKFSPTCRWIMNRELMGSVLLSKGRADGIILLSAFPCGPDSMTNELLTRRLTGIPVLNLVLDAQTGTAGMETRLESFIDIIRFKEGKHI